MANVSWLDTGSLVERNKLPFMKTIFWKIHGPLSLALTLAWVGCASSPTSESAGEMIDSAGITAKAKAAMVRDSTVSAMQVKVKTWRGVVQLSGFVDSEEQKKRAGEIARGIEGVREVQNNIVIKPGVSK